MGMAAWGSQRLTRPVQHPGLTALQRCSQPDPGAPCLLNRTAPLRAPQGGEAWRSDCGCVAESSQPWPSVPWAPCTRQAQPSTAQAGRPAAAQGCRLCGQLTGVVLLTFLGASSPCVLPYTSQLKCSLQAAHSLGAGSHPGAARRAGGARRVQTLPGGMEWGSQRGQRAQSLQHSTARCGSPGLSRLEARGRAHMLRAVSKQNMGSCVKGVPQVRGSALRLATSLATCSSHQLQACRLTCTRACCGHAALCLHAAREWPCPACSWGSRNSCTPLLGPAQPVCKRIPATGRCTDKARAPVTAQRSRACLDEGRCLARPARACQEDPAHIGGRLTDVERGESLQSTSPRTVTREGWK